MDEMHIIMKCNNFSAFIAQIPNEINKTTTIITVCCVFKKKLWNVFMFLFK